MNDLFRHAASCIRQNHRLLEHWTTNFTTRKSLVLESITNKNHTSSSSTFIDLLQTPSSTSSSSSLSQKHHVNKLNQMANQIFDTLLISTNEAGFQSSSLPRADANIQNLIEFRQSFLAYFPSSSTSRNSNNNNFCHSLTSSSSSSSTVGGFISGSDGDHHQCCSYGGDVEIPFGITPQFRTPRKERQIRKIAGIIRHLKRQSGVESVVDVGGGTGLLAELLACDFGISTCVLERDQRLIEKGRQHQSSRATKRLLRRLECRVDISNEITMMRTTGFNSNSKNNKREDSSSSSSSSLQNTVTNICSSCLLTGVHACGSLSDVVFLNAMKHEKIRSFMIVPCCHQKKIIPHQHQHHHDGDNQAILFSELSQCDENNILVNQKETSSAMMMKMTLGSFLNNVNYLKLANFSHELSRDQFLAFSRKFLFQHCLMELFHKNRALFDKMFIEFGENNNQNREMMMKSITSPGMISKIISKMSGDARDSNTCGFSLGTRNQRVVTQNTRNQRKRRRENVDENEDDDHYLPDKNNSDGKNAQNFSFFCENFVKAYCCSYCHEGEILNHDRKLLPPSSSSLRNELDAFCDDLFSPQSPTFLELYYFLYNKCVVDMLGSSMEAAIFLDRAVTIQEDNNRSDRSKKWENVYCGSLFPSSISPRRFGLWGIKKDPVLLLR